MSTRTAYDWVEAITWTCPRCLLAILTRELSPTCPRCGYRESAD